MKMKKFLIPMLLIIFCLISSVQASTNSKYKGISYIYNVNTTADNIVIDGKISTDEWGNPVCTFTPQSVSANYNIGWEYRSNTDSLPTDQRVEIYFANDGNGLYLGCKLIGADYDPGPEKIADLKNHPHFGFSFANYDKDTVVYRTTHKNRLYEKYGHFVVGMVDGFKYSKSVTQGMDVVNLLNKNYEMSYDANTRTYIYEVFMPEGSTPVNFANDNTLVISFDIGGPNNGEKANRYLISQAAELSWIGTGPDKFVHYNTSPILFLIQSNSTETTGEFVATMADDPQSAYLAENQLSQPAQQGIPVEVAWISAGVALLLLSAAVIMLIVRCRKRKKQGD